MARKRATFQWDSEEGYAERVARPSRSEERKHIRGLERLALELSRMGAGRRRSLPLDPRLAEALTELARTPPSPAHKRQLGRVKGMLMSADVEAIRAALAGDGAADERLRTAERWRARLLDEGNAALTALVAAHREVDLQRVRQLLRVSVGESSKAVRARKQLFRAILDVLDAAEG